MKKKEEIPKQGIRAELLARVEAIPRGCVVSYGALGQALTRPCSGLVVGKLLANVLEDIPWWRVVGAKGDLLLRRRSVRLGDDQERLLRSEGVDFDEEGRVVMEKHEITQF